MSGSPVHQLWPPNTAPEGVIPDGPWVQVTIKSDAYFFESRVKHGVDGDDYLDYFRHFTPRDKPSVDGAAVLRRTIESLQAIEQWILSLPA